MAGGPYDIIEARSPRGPRRWIGVAVLAALVLVPVVSLLSGREPGSVPQPPPPVPTRAEVVAKDAPNVLYPRPRHRGGREILNVVFPDGSAAEVGYPAELGLARLGVRPAMTGRLDGEVGTYRQLTVPPGGPAGVAMGRPMIRKLAGQVTLWHPMSPAEGEVLLFAFDPWFVALRDLKGGMSFEQRMLWARNLRGRVTRDGYLVLDARAPVRLAGPGETFRGEQVGPQLWFGGARETLLVLAPVPGCDVAAIELSVIEQRRRFSAETCQDGVYVAASGERGQVERAVAEIVVRRTA
ncbi:hypothetical protein [Streptosporangium amethystogenes]|uniref:hypothetical protein n=1 Tax=Streptosporangium amethystogenes TaxID=2002 RepID=UPI0004CBF056|nr:hypothetical protein [Streptosporangium amethystogenes]